MSTTINKIKDLNGNDVISKYAERDSKGRKISQEIDMLDKKLYNISELLKGHEYTLENGTSPSYNQVCPVGSQRYAELGMIGGKCYVENQLVQNGNFANTDNWSNTNATFSVNNNILTMTASAKFGRIFQNLTTNQISGHRYLITFDIKPTSNISGANITCVLNNGARERGITNITANANVWSTQKVIITSTEDGTFNRLVIYDNRESERDAIQVKNVMVVDLTIYPSSANTPSQFLLDNPQYNDYVAYNTGTLKIAKVNKVITKNTDNEVIQELNIPTQIINLDGYGQSNGGTYNKLDLVNKKFIAYGHLVNDTWVAYDTPLETDISQYLPDDIYYLDTQVGGTITFSQVDTQVSVPNTITYMVRNTEAI